MIYHPVVEVVEMVSNLLDCYTGVIQYAYVASATIRVTVVRREAFIIYHSFDKAVKGQQLPVFLSLHGIRHAK